MRVPNLLSVVLTASLLTCVASVSAMAAPPPTQPPGEGPSTDPHRQRVVGVEFLGEVTFDTGFQFEGTEVGGLSGIVYNPSQEVYYALSDDRSQINPARFYTLAIDLSDGQLDAGDIEFVAVTTLLDGSGQPFAEASLDPEGIVDTGCGLLYVASEGDANSLIPPFIDMFSAEGEMLAALPIPDKFLPGADGASGNRNNLSFESLTKTPDGRFLYAATENALSQDGPVADLEQESLSRIIKYDLETGQPVQEFVYVVDAVADEPEPANGFRTNGLVELLATDNNGTLLALERSYSDGKGNTLKLYEVLVQGALDVSSQDDLFWEEEGIPFEIDPAVQKRELVNFADLGVTPDNLEGLTFGPVLPDGRQTLIVVSDNNFSPTQATQFIALALEFETVPAALPVLETPGTIDDEEAEAPLLGDSDDPAIWVHPARPTESLVIATLKDGGLVVFDLDGEVVQTIAPEAYSDVRYNNVDLVYGFELGGEPADLAVVSDRENDTLAIFKIDPDTRQLVDVTAPDIIESIFGVDDGSQTAYGLATYTSPLSGLSYAFVTQRDGNQVAQLELADNGSGQVQASVVRMLELPVPTGEPEDSQSEGIVVDRQLGVLYVGVEDEVGVLKASAEPDDESELEVIIPIDAEFFEPDIEGLTIYYGPGESGYLIVSSQGDSTYAVFERAGDNQYLGSFVIGDNDTIDQVNESDGADVINVSLGDDYAYGLLVVQDGANDPQSVVQDDEQLENNSTNFKFVPWENVANAFPEPLLIDPSSYNPRPQESLELQTRVNQGEVWPGGYLMVTLAVKNPSAGSQSFLVENVIPEHTSYFCGQDQALYEAESNSIRWRGTVGPRQTQTVHFWVQVDPDAEAGTLISNTAGLGDGAFEGGASATAQVVERP